MRIEQLALEAYGHYRDVTLELSAPVHGLTVVYGPNEAGKSTARRAVIDALFGVERTTPDAHRVGGPHGLRLGARLRAADGETVSFRRQGLSGLVTDDGSALDVAALDRLLGGIDRVAYRRLFAIDHDELRRGSESLLDAEGEIGRLVFGASLGSGSVAAVLRRLEERAASLYRDKGSAQQVPKALKAYRDGMRAVKDSRVRARDWDRLRQDVDDATARLDDVRNSFEKARGEQLRLGRVRAARPIVARRRELVQQLDELGEVPTPQWAARATDALTGYREALATHRRAAAERQGLADQAASIEVPAAVLAVAPAIDELVELIGRYRKDVGDLPELRTKLAVAQQSVQVQLQRLGKQVDDPHVVAEIDLVAVEALAHRQTALVTEERGAATELRRARERVAEVRDRLDRLPETPDVAGLSRVLELARPKVETARALVTERAEHEVAAKDVASRAARLGLGSLDLDGIEGLEVPALADVDTERDRRQSHRLQREQLDREQDALATELAALERRVTAATSQAPDPARLEVARAHRDRGWRAVRAVLEGQANDSVEPVGSGQPVTPTPWGDGRPLADAYEAATAEADAAADERYDHADVLATVLQLRAQRETLSKKAEALEGRRRTLVEEDGAAMRAWEARWSALGVEAGSPEAMTVWCRQQQELVAAIGRLRQLGARITGADQEVGRRVSELSAALVGMGEVPGGDELDLLVVQAAEVVERVREAVTERRTAGADLEQAERELSERQATLARTEQALDKWRTSWAAALGALGLAASTTAEAAVAAVTAHRALAAARNDVASLERRIDGIGDDCRQYEERVAAVASGLGEDQGGTPLAAVPVLQRRARQCRDAQQRRQATEEQLQDVEAMLRRAEVELDGARDDLEGLRSEAALAPAGEEPDTGIDEMVARAEAAATLRQRVAEADEALLDQSQGFDVHELEAEAMAAGDVLDGQLEALSTEVDARQKELESATAGLADARRALAAVTESATAADLEQEAETELALAAASAAEYARTALAAEVLRRTIADYGERHRGPLLDRAAVLLGHLTLGGFVDLVVDADGERQVLLAKRAGDELCPVMALSDGTRDQLYLALRLAGLEHQLAEVGDPLPVVLDDLLVNFDDTRTAAALRALCDLGKRTQVLLFTHHRRIVELAERELDASTCHVVELEPRRDEPLPSASAGGLEPAEAGPCEPVTTVGVAFGPGELTAEERVVAALRSAAGQALGKADLLELGGVSAGEWPPAIRSLVASGRIVQEGQRRGTRYRLASGTA